MPQFRNLLVGVDLSHGDWMTDAANETPSELACQRAIELAKGTGASVHFLAALDLDAKTQRLLRESSGMEDDVLTEGKRALDRLVERAAAEGVKADSSVTIGKAWKEILRYAGDNGSDLVVLGSRRQTAMRAMLLGSTSLHVLNEAVAPVWIIRLDYDVLDKIMVATDFSPVCDRLLAKAAELAALFQAELHIVHVVEPQGKGFWQFGNNTWATEEEHEAALRQGEANLTKVASSLANLPAAPQLHLREGAVAEVLLDLTTSLEIDVLAMGLVAWGGVQGALIGSTAQAMLPRLECSLLSMRGTKSS